MTCGCTPYAIRGTFEPETIAQNGGKFMVLAPSLGDGATLGRVRPGTIGFRRASGPIS
jgi:hypothetical protein